MFVKNDKGASPAIIAITTVVMAYYVSFFQILIQSGTERTAGIITAAYFIALFAIMMKTGNFSKYRNIFVISASLMMVPSFINIMIEERGTMMIQADTIINNENPFCHIVFTMVTIPAILKQGIIFPARLTGHFASVYSMLVIWLVAALVFGRGWCSWVCFYSGWDSCFSSIGKKPLVKLDLKNNKLRYFNFTMLAFVALASLPALSVVYCELLCPFKLVTEFEAPVDLFSIVAFALMIITFLVLIVVMPFLTKKRFQCMCFCPFGAMQSLFNKISFFRVRFDKDKCTKCGACAAVCPTLSISQEFLANDKLSMPLTCTMCGRCFSVCKNGAISYSFLGLPLPAVTIGDVNSIRNTLRNFMCELLSPQTLFPFAAFLFGTIVSGSFIRMTFKLFIEHFIH